MLIHRSPKYSGSNYDFPLCTMPQEVILVYKHGIYFKHRYLLGLRYYVLILKNGWLLPLLFPFRYKGVFQQHLICMPISVSHVDVFDQYQVFTFYNEIQQEMMINHCKMQQRVLMIRKMNLIIIIIIIIYCRNPQQCMMYINNI